MARNEFCFVREQAIGCISSPLKKSESKEMTNIVRPKTWRLKFRWKWINATVTEYWLTELHNIFEYLLTYGIYQKLYDNQI